MKELNVSEISMISGGKVTDNEGYNFAFVVKNTLEGLCYGLALGIIFPSMEVVCFMPLLFGGYATAMLFAKAADGYFFQPAENNPLPTR